MKKLLFLLIAMVHSSLAIADAELPSTVKSQQFQVKETGDCSKALDHQTTASILERYRSSKYSKQIIQVAGIDLDGDTHCDLLVEYQEEYPICASDTEKNCNQFQQAERTDFYVANSGGEFDSVSASVERERWTSGGKYIAYTVAHDEYNLIVWDLRGQGRKHNFADSYSAFKWGSSISYLDAYTTFHPPITKAQADLVFEKHSQKYP
ncbi:hypothetical protein TDB9533_01056 [Thalassocella blandensis]|nr:hypothetical protein TDB9533_01056 [Thalassocella blandensis]